MSASTDDSALPRHRPSVCREADSSAVSTPLVSPSSMLSLISCTCEVDSPRSTCSSTPLAEKVLTWAPHKAAFSICGNVAAQEQPPDDRA
eukprot:81641-Chlamydomonas_euryale.AAC.29